MEGLIELDEIESPFASGCHLDHTPNLEQDRTTWRGDHVVLLSADEDTRNEQEDASGHEKGCPISLIASQERPRDGTCSTNVYCGVEPHIDALDGDRRTLDDNLAAWECLLT